VAVGEEVRSRQQLMIIPDMGSLQVKTRVYESVIQNVKPDLETFVRLDARPDAVLRGKVSRVAVLPDSQNPWLDAGVKVYEVIVKLNETPDDLKPGMTAHTEIVLARFENVLTVPIAAVFAERENAYCWRVRDGKPERAGVRVGQMNDARAEILQGLTEGERVLLAPPEGADAGKAVSSRPAGGSAAGASKNGPAEKPRDRKRDRNGQRAEP